MDWIMRRSSADRARIMRGTALIAALFMAVTFAMAPAHAQQLVSATLSDDGILEIIFDAPVNASSLTHNRITVTDGMTIQSGTRMSGGDLDTDVTGDRLRYILNDNRLNTISGYSNPILRIDPSGLGPGVPEAYGLPSQDYAYPYILDRGSFTPTEGSPQGLAISPDGTLLFVVGSQRDEVLRYELDPPYDTTSASLNGSYDISSEEGGSRGIAFSADGTRMFIIGDNNRVYQYSLSTPFSFDGTVSFELNYNVVSQDNQMSGIDFALEGRRMYLAGDGSNNIYQYNVFNPYNLDITEQSFFVRHTGTFSVGDEDAGPRGVSVAADGRSMLVLGQTNDKVYRYDMHVPNDITTSTYAGSLDISDQGNNVRGLATSTDGRNIFVSNTDGSGSVHRYDLGSPYDMPEGVGASILNITGENNSPTGVAFSNDGLRMFTVEAQTDMIHEYTMTSPYNTASATLTKSAPAFVLADGTPGFTGTDASPSDVRPVTGDAPQDIEFNSHGRKMYILGAQTARVYQYTLTPDYNIAGATLDDTYNVSQENGGPSAQFGRERTPTGMEFNPGGDIMLITGRGSNDIHQYNLDNPYDLSRRTTADSNRINNIGTFPTGLAYSEDGHRLFVSERDSGTVQRYDLPTPYMLNGARYVDSRAILDDDPQIHDVAFSFDGRRMFAVGAQNDNVYTYNLTAPFDITTTGEGQRLRFSGDNLVADVSFGDSGRELFVLEAESETVLRYSLEIPYELATAIPQSSSPALGDASLRALEFSPNGTLMFVSGWVNLRVDAYSMSTPFDVSTAQLTGDSFDPDDAANKPADDVNRPTALRFSSDGTMLFVLDQTVRKLFQYELDSPYYIGGTPRFERSLNVVSQLSAPQGFAFSADGTSLHITGAGNDRISRYALGTAYELSTASPVGSQSIADLEDSASGLAFNRDGSRVFVSGSDSELADSEDSVYSFDLTDSVPLNTAPAAPRLLSAVLDGRELTMIFDDDIDVSSILPNRIEIREGQDAGVTLASFSVSGGTVTSVLSPDNATMVSGYADPVVRFEVGALAGVSGGIFPSFDVESLSPVLNRFAISDDPDLTFAERPGQPITGSVRSGSFITATVAPSGATFSADGTTMLFVGDSTDGSKQVDELHVCTMTSPYDITSLDCGRDVVDNLDMSETATTGVTFSPDGLNVFVSGRDGRTATDPDGAIYSYRSVHPFTIQEPSSTPEINLAGRFTLNVSGNVNNTEDVEFSTDGMRMFVLGNIGVSFGGFELAHGIVEYDLVSPYTLNGATTALGQSISLGLIDPTGMAITSDGLRMYVIDRGTGLLWWYDMPANSITGFTTRGFLDVGSLDTSLEDVMLHGNDEAIFLLGAGRDTVYGYGYGIDGHADYALGIRDKPDLGVESATFFNETGTLNVLFTDTVAGGSVDPARINVVNVTGEVVALSNAEMPTLAGRTLSFELGTSRNFTDPVLEFGASAVRGADGGTFPSKFAFPGDPLVYEGALNVSAQVRKASGVSFTPDGTKMYVTDTGPGRSRLNQYLLSDPFNVSSAMFDHQRNMGTGSGSSFEQSEAGIPSGFVFAPGGTRMFVASADRGWIGEYFSFNPYDARRLSYSRGLDTSPQDANPTGVTLSPDASIMFVTGNETDSVYSYGVTALNAETAVHMESLDVSAQTADPTGVSIPGDGLELFVTAGGTGDIHRYSLVKPYTLDGAAYDGKFGTDEDDPQGMFFPRNGEDLYVAGPGGIHTYLLDTVGVRFVPASMLGTMHEITISEGIPIVDGAMRVPDSPMGVIHDITISEGVSIMDMGMSVIQNQSTFTITRTDSPMVSDDRMTSINTPPVGPGTPIGASDMPVVSETASSICSPVCPIILTGSDALDWIEDTIPGPDTEVLPIVRILATSNNTLEATLVHNASTTMNSSFSWRVADHNVELEINGTLVNSMARPVARNNIVITSPDVNFTSDNEIVVRFIGVTDSNGIVYGLEYNLTGPDKALIGDQPEVILIPRDNLLVIHEHTRNPLVIDDATGVEQLILHFNESIPVDGTPTMAPEIEIRGDGITVLLREGLGISGFADLSQIIVEETNTKGDIPDVRYGRSFEVGDPDADLEVEPPAEITLIGQGGSTGYRIDLAGMTNVIVACEGNVDGAFPSGVNACSLDRGNDLVIWTRDLSIHGGYTDIPGQGPGPIVTPQPRGGGGGGGGGGSVLSGTGLGYDARFEFTAGGEGVLSGSSIRIQPGNTLVIQPLLTPAGLLTVFDMEVYLTGAGGESASVYYNRLGAFFGKECLVESTQSEMTKTCDESSIISGAATPVLDGGSLESISIPLEGEFAGTVSIMLRDNQGITLATHDRDRFSLNTGGAAAPDAGVPSIDAAEPGVIPPAAGPVDEPRAEPRQNREEPRDEPAASDTMDEAGQAREIPEDQQGSESAAETAGDSGGSFLDAIADFFRSLFGMS
ncbi:hypothetical protein CENSYa_0846 [Cenarchaeum symbiosum A]|uniref:Uncharacterized protein n=1 Tax=Cenarchaeum symbiosum (strain A) TaxID=414004 RepID=A0RVW2_CENSY|nr:hypothetical protein CENSYa_0846 [Cenarchaeum symbiosum A]